MGPATIWVPVKTEEKAGPVNFALGPGQFAKGAGVGRRLRCGIIEKKKLASNQKGPTGPGGRGDFASPSEKL